MSERPPPKSRPGSRNRSGLLRSFHDHADAHGEYAGAELARLGNAAGSKNPHSCLVRVFVRRTGTGHSPDFPLPDAWSGSPALDAC